MGVFACERSSARFFRQALFFRPITSFIIKKNAYYKHAYKGCNHAFASSPVDENLPAHETAGFGAGPRPLGLSPGAAPRSRSFWRSTGSTSKRLADCCEIEPAAAGSILLRMETAGLVTRRNRPDNRRSLYVSLTPTGQKMAQTVQDIFAAAEAQITAGLTEEERATLYELLSKCLQNGKGTVK